MPRLSGIRTAQPASADPKGSIHPSAWKGVLTTSPKRSSRKCMRVGTPRKKEPALILVAL
jgi:hypothetical protein